MQVKSQKMLPEYSILSDEGIPLAARGRVQSHSSLGFSRLVQEETGNLTGLGVRTMKHEYLSYEGIPICARRVFPEEGNGRNLIKMHSSHSEWTETRAKNELAAINQKVAMILACCESFNI